MLKGGNYQKIQIDSIKSALEFMKCQTYITENNMDNVIIHAGSNELDSERQADMIAKSFKYGAQSVN